MNKNQFFAKFQNLNLRREELERQWKVHLEEQEEMNRRWQMLREAEDAEGKQNSSTTTTTSNSSSSAASAGSGGAGGGGGSIVILEDETFLEFFKIDGSDTWKYFLMNVSGIKSELLDSGISADWSIDWYFPPVQKKGYAAVFRGPDTYTFIMINTDGTLLGSFTTETNWWNGDDLDGRAIAFYYTIGSDYNFIYYDGENYRQTLFTGSFSTGNIQNFNIGTDWDYTTIDNKTLVTIEYSNGDQSYRILDIHGNNEFYYLVSGNIRASVAFYSFGNFILLFLYDNNTNQYTRLQLYNTSGILLSVDIDLTAVNIFDNLDYNFYGTNKLQAIFSNSGNNAIDYYIVNYNGTTTNAIITSQIRGPFVSIITQTENKYPFNNLSFDPEGILNTFYSWDGYDGFIRTGYAKFTFLFEGDSAYGEYLFTNSGVPDKGVIPWIQSSTSDSAGVIVDGLNGSLTNLLFFPGGSTSSIPLALTSDMDSINNFSYSNCGSKKLFSYPVTGSTGTRWKLYSAVGSLLGSIFTTTNSYSDTRYNSFYVRQYDSGNERFWYFNNSVTSFTEISPAFVIDNVYQPFYEIPDNIDKGPFLFFNIATPCARILSIDNTPGTLDLPPTSNDYRIGLAIENFFYVYQDIDSKVIINLYDLAGTLLNTISTEFTSVASLNDYISVEHRFVFVFVEGSTYTTYMMTPTSVETDVTTDVLDRGRMVNDFAYYDD